MAIVLTAAACGGPSAPPAKPQSPVASTGAPAHAHDAAEPAPPAPITESECDRFLDHAASLWVAEKADSEGWRDDDAAAIRAEFRASNLDRCLEMPRPTFECAMRSKSAADMRKC